MTSSESASLGVQRALKRPPVISVVLMSSLTPLRHCAADAFEAGLIDPAVAVLAIADEADREFVGRQRHVDHGGETEAIAAVLDRAEVGLGVGVELRSVRLVRDEADVARHRVRPVQGSLRAVEHFDALDVDELDRRILAAAVLLVARGDHVLVEVGADYGRSAAVDTADDVFGIAGTEVLELQAGHAAGEGFESRLALEREIGAADRVNRFRSFLHVRLAALGGGDDHFFERWVGSSAAYTCVHAATQTSVAARPQLSFQRMIMALPIMPDVTAFVNARDLTA